MLARNLFGTIVAVPQIATRVGVAGGGSRRLDRVDLLPKFAVARVEATRSNHPATSARTQIGSIKPDFLDHVLPSAEGVLFHAHVRRLARNGVEPLSFPR